VLPHFEPVLGERVWEWTKALLALQQGYSSNGRMVGMSTEGTLFTIHGPLLGQASVCEPILRALPQWFGMEAALRHYVAEIEALPTLLAAVGGRFVGFLSLKQHYVSAAEIYVMGIEPAFRRQGIGRALLQQAEAHLQRQGIEYLQVKTLSDSRADPNYAQTRAFYHAVGFTPLEEIIAIWGEQNPCLIMIKYLPPL